MAYVGATPAKIPLTSSDLADSIVTASKIATNAVEEAKVNADAITSAKIAAGAIVDSDINASAAIGNTKLANYQITIDGVTVALGASATVVTKPTITSLTPSVIPNTATAVVIAGTNFTNMPSVEAINSTGAIVVADSITYTSAASITATFTLPVDGTYFIRIENPDGVAVRTATAALTVSDAPEWVTASGTLGTFSGDAAIATQTLTATDATSFAITSGGIATGLTFTTGVGSCTITGTQTEHSGATTDNFTVTATDAEGQTAARAFSMSWSFSIGQGGQFN